MRRDVTNPSRNFPIRGVEYHTETAEAPKTISVHEVERAVVLYGADGSVVMESARRIGFVRG